MKNSLAPNIELSYVPSQYNCYPNETITCYVQLTVQAAITGPATLEFYLPFGLEMVQEVVTGLGRVKHGGAPKEVNWLVMGLPKAVEYNTASVRFDAGLLEPGHTYEYAFRIRSSSSAHIPRMHANSVATVLYSNHADPVVLKTWVKLQAGADENAIESRVLTIKVHPQAKSLQYLPGIYHEDEQQFLWRYLMIFDGFWAVFEDRIHNIANYFDPYLAPPDFIPWLASWVGAVWDERLSENSRKQFVAEMVDLHRKRGTRQGLEKMLKICMDLPEDDTWKLDISERPVGNFLLSEQTEMGEDLVVGDTEQMACYFTVNIVWPPGVQPLPHDLLRSLIDTWKPAHAVYDFSSSRAEDTQQ